MSSVEKTYLSDADGNTINPATKEGLAAILARLNDLEVSLHASQVQVDALTDEQLRAAPVPVDTGLAQGVQEGGNVVVNQGTSPWVIDTSLIASEETLIALLEAVQDQEFVDAVTVTNLPENTEGPWLRSGAYLVTDGVTYSPTIDWKAEGNRQYEQGFFSTVAASASDISILVHVESSDSPAFPATETHTGYKYTQLTTNRRYPVFYYGFKYTRLKFFAPVNDLTKFEVSQFFVKGFGRSTPRQFGEITPGDSHHDFSTIAEIKGINEVTGDADPVGLTQNRALRVADENTTRTPNGSVWVEGIRNDVSYEYGSVKGAEALGRLINMSSSAGAGGSVALDTSEGQLVISTPAIANSLAFFYTPEVAGYAPAQGVRFDMTAQPLKLPVGLQYYEWGMTDPTRQNGTGYRLDALGLSVFRRKNGNIVYQKYTHEWNRDKCDGQEPSRFRLAGQPYSLVPINNNRYFGDHEWLGAASLVKGIKSPSNFFIETDVEEYAGTTTGSSMPNASLHLYMAIFNSTEAEVLTLRSGSWRGGIFTSESDVKVIQITDDLLFQGLGDGLLQQFTVGTMPTRLDLTQVPNRRSVAVRNISASGSNAAIGYDNTIGFNGAAWPLFGASKDGISKLASNDMQFWALAEDTGGVESSLRRGPGAAPTGTATSPGNAQTTNDSRAVMDAVGETILANTYTSGTANTIVSVKLGLEARKDPLVPTETVTQDPEIIIGTSASGTNLNTGVNVTANDDRLYIARIALQDVGASINSIAGLGLTWLDAGADAIGGDARVATWYAYGSPSTDGIVTATLSISSRGIIAVSQFLGVDPVDPVEAVSISNGTGTSYSGTLTGTDLGVTLVVAGCGNQTHTAGSGALETSETSTGTGSNTLTMAATREENTVTGSQSYAGTFSGSSDWAVSVITLRPQDALDPEVELTYKLSGVTGATSGILTFTTDVDDFGTVDISADRVWAGADIVLITEVKAELLSLGAAALEIDYIFIDLVDTTGNTARLVIDQMGEPVSD